MACYRRDCKCNKTTLPRPAVEDDKSPTIPADWAIAEALKRCNRLLPVEVAKDFRTSNITTFELARMIEEYEKPSIDPDILIIRELMIAYWEDTFDTVARFKNGSLDNCRPFKRILAKYKELHCDKTS